MQRIFIYLFNGYSDWELAYVTPELAKSNQCELIYMTDDGKPVTSMGGLMVTPHVALTAVNPDQVDMLILPGGTMWEQTEPLAIESMVHLLHRDGKTIAAICGATSYLAKLGLLNHAKHTSNALCYLKWVVPTYTGDEWYVEAHAVVADHIITAGGVYPIEFALEIMEQLKLHDEDALEKWYQLYKNGIWKE